MSGYCLGCHRTVDVMVLGDWMPPWALCPDCAAKVARDDTEEKK